KALRMEHRDRDKMRGDRMRGDHRGQQWGQGRHRPMGPNGGAPPPPQPNNAPQAPAAPPQ
ncbi:MAG: hypothetical protein WBD06_02385, partial [Acidobacteriaceae bacterium]